MHILVVHQYFLGKNDAGGSRWNQFAKYWAQAGHKITVLTGTVHYATGRKQPEYKGRFIVRERQGNNVEVLRCHVSDSYNKSQLGRMWGYVSFLLSSTVAGIFVKKPDIIICTSPPLTVGLTGAILSKIKRVPMVFEVRDLWPESVVDLGVIRNKWVIKLMYWIQRVSYNSAKWINVLTPAFEEFLVKANQVPREKISMIPNAADLDIIKPGPRDNWVREKYNLGNKFVVTYIGAHGRANCLMQLLEAAKLLKEHPEIVIMLVGDGMEKSALIAEAKTNGLDNITFADAVPKSQIGDYINASDVCTAVLKNIEVYKTVYPNKVFDYMVAAKPVIISIDGVARKLIEDADSGIYVEPENAQEFAEAVLALKENPQLCSEYGQNGLNFVRQHYSRASLADKYLDILVNKVVV
jgi:glycosyltransferase involved in cell wall biosynthesis